MAKLKTAAKSTATVSGKPKTLAEISQVISGGMAKASRQGIADYLGELSPAQLEETFKIIEKTYEKESERLGVYTKLKDIVAGIHGMDSTGYELLEKLVKKSEERLSIELKTEASQKKQVETLRKGVLSALDDIIKKNREIFQTSHDIQLQGNQTWQQMTQLYDQAYESARRMNSEMSKQLFTAGEIVKAQEVMLGAGWRGIDTQDITNLSAQAILLTRTLGQFPRELHFAFQMSFRQFGSETDRFINAIGNQLNTFSDTFGMNINILSQTVSSMMAANSFIARNNMEAQLAANQSLMQALALSTSVGINTSGFITQLAKTAQFGTASQMADIYQAGAYLQDFSVSDFQTMMIDQDYEGATQSLISSIHNTLSGMEPGYLRNEYMQRIGQGFGLSQDDILQIMTNGNDLAAYSADIQEKLVGINTSMEDEISELHMTIDQQFKNYWQNGVWTQAIGKVMNEFGLYDLNGLVKYTNALLTIMVTNTMFGGAGSGAGGFLGNIGSTISKGLSSPSGFVMGPATMGGRLGLGAAGLGLGIGSNMLGSHMISSNTSDDMLTNVAGGSLNLLGGTAGGALTGAMIGGPIGAAIGGAIGFGVGAFNMLQAEGEKQSRMEQIEDERRQKARESQVRIARTGDPIVDAINQMNANLTNILQGEFEQNRQVEILLDATRRNSVVNK